MRGLAVLTVVFVFASGALFVGSASAQSSGSLSGQLCVLTQYSGYPMPASDGGSDPGSSCMYSQPLPGAKVTLTPSGALPVVGGLNGNPSATSDDSGAYSISNLAAGEYSFSVTRVGFKTVTGTLTIDGASQRDWLLAGEQVDASGRVLGPDGSGLNGATVSFCCDGNGSAQAASGPDGTFATKLVAGWWSLDVQAPGFIPASQYRLVDGAVGDVKMERIPPQDSRIEGTVVDQDGNPVPGVRVSIYNYGGCCYAYDTYPAEMSYRPSYYAGENSTLTDADGRFAMNAYSGENSLSLYKDGYASHSRQLTLQPGQTADGDSELLKFPEKTAKLVGKVVDAKSGKGLPNVYINLQSPQYGLYECSSRAGASGSGSSGSGSSEPGSGSATAASTGMAKPAIAPAPDYYDPGCAITVRDDGSFEGLVSPGYAILSVWVDHYASCAESSDADGSFTRTCGPEYYSFTVSRVLAEDATSTFDIRLRSRPAPDAEVSGYVIDAETGKALPGAQVSFSNQDTYGYGTATTDADGSYRLRLRSGFHTVSVWAEGHLRWEGTLDVAKGDSPFDVTVQPGQESYGSCCYPYYGGVAYAEDSAVKSSGSGAMSATSTSAPNAAPQALGASEDGAQGEQYQDLGGGLGPYDASKRDSELQEPSSGAPGLGLVALLAALGALVLVRRRLA